MVTLAEIEPLRFTAVDHQDTERLKRKFARLRAERQPLYLTHAEFEEILDWKLGAQRGRSKRWWAFNNDDLVRQITALALNIVHPDTDYQLQLRAGILSTMRGVGVPVASAVLALVFPSEYAVIDFRVWRQLFEEEKKVFFIPDYRRYMRALRPLAARLGWDVQEVDHAIWEYDRRVG
jgi:hypothetical protein